MPRRNPLGILRRIVKVHSRPGDMLCDFFAGSGSFGAAALELGRDCVLVDENPEALRVMERRFAGEDVRWHGWPPIFPHGGGDSRRGGERNARGAPLTVLRSRIERIHFALLGI